MKRKPFDRYAVRAIRTLLSWNPCCSCGLDFRREPGWYKESLNANIRFGHYVCGTCAPTEAEALVIFKARPWLPPMPAVRPPAPPRPLGVAKVGPY